MANNTLKYKRIDAAARAEKRARWNRPVVWPLFLLVIAFVAVIVPAVLAYIRREHQARAGGGT